MVWAEQEGPGIDASSSNLLSLSRDYAFEETGLTGDTKGRRRWNYRVSEVKEDAAPSVRFTNQGEVDGGDG